ncbi:MAG: pyridoxal phosphate-dependent aminotransferase [Methanococci archaeon]|nr:pyridoxal phosphate-dependent aminotransferase [Methanococci archaeon]
MLSKRMLNFDSFEVMDILTIAQKLESEGKHVIHLEIGEPDFNTPKPIIEEGINSLKDGKTHYTDSRGIIELREKICELYLKKYGVNLNPNNNVIITGGSSLGLFFALSSIIDEGDEVLIQNPCYPCYKNFIRFLGAKPVFCDFTIESLENAISKKTKAIIINSPSNPLGETVKKEIYEFAYDNIPYIISDEIYNGLVYDGKNYSAVEFDENMEKTILINGFSKLYAMTGWRLGYVISNSKIMDAILKLQQNLFISAPTISQYSALKAFEEETEKIVKKMLNEFNRRRKLVLKYVKNFGWKVNNPIGAYYVFPNIGEDGKEFTYKLLKEKHVALAPGIGFGSKGKNHVRISYANSYENIKEGLERIKEFLE